MSDTSANNKCIAKNPMLLYVRMLMSIAVHFTSHSRYSGILRNQLPDDEEIKTCIDSTEYEKSPEY